MLEIYVAGAFMRHSIEYALCKVSADTSLIRSQGFGPIWEYGFRPFHRDKMSSEDTQNKHNKMLFLQKSN